MMPLPRLKPFFIPKMIVIRSITKGLAVASSLWLDYNETNMRISDALVEKLLTADGSVTDEELVNLREQQKGEKKPLQDLVIKNNLVTEAELTQLYAREIDLPFAELHPKEIKKEILKLVPERVARQYGAVLFAVEKDGTKNLAMADPDDIQAVNFLKKQLGEDLNIYVATQSNIQNALEEYRGNIGNELTKVMTGDEDSEPAEEEVSEEDLAEDSPIAQTVNLLIEYAIRSGASDIHIEPREQSVSVRYRVDGVLREANKLPKKVMGALVSRIKILSNLKIDEKRVPQDGRFKIQLAGTTYALRVSTLPINDGEKVVMRILDESTKAATLEELGFWGISLASINKAIKQPHGMILVTGPTGSGKSTSLFSILSLLNKPAVNISTIEDPVEYRIEGANQTQVNVKAGMTFAAGLRALLRQDPNIIMVGEIRDKETAGLGTQAALTGHLVFATLHTNNAATCLPRLLDMGIEPFLIASTVRAVVGQRLVRKLCPDCRVEVAAEPGEIKQIMESFGLTDPAVFKQIHELEKQALEAGIGKNSEGKAKVNTSTLSTTESKINKLYKASDDGCDTCGHSGYRSRMGIYEVLANSDAVEKLIVGNATSEELQDQAIKDGMINMQLDGLVKAFRGETTVEEILRVTAES
jgi:type IV pilus assembly protein PilB